jgi:hypothetical protein
MKQTYEFAAVNKGNCVNISFIPPKDCYQTLYTTLQFKSVVFNADLVLSPKTLNFIRLTMEEGYTFTQIVGAVNTTFTETNIYDEEVLAITLKIVKPAIKRRNTPSGAVLYFKYSSKTHVVTLTNLEVVLFIEGLISQDCI